MNRVLLIICLSIALLGIVFAQFEITIDAEKDAFYGTLTGPDDGFIYFPIEAVGQGSAINEPPVDENDLSAHVWLAWDETYLYTYFEIWDDIILVNNATNYQNDAVEFKIDPDPFVPLTGDPANCRLSALGENDADDPVGVDYPGKDAGLGEIYDAIEDVDYARKETDKGYNLEWRLPWEHIFVSDVTVDVNVNSIFGLAINIMDNDETQRTTALQWSAGLDDLVWNNRLLHGTVTFLADNKLKLEPVCSADGAPDPVSDPSWYIPEIDAVGTELDATMPSDFSLAQNYPNPFNPTTTIKFSVPKTSKVTLSVYDVLGKQVAILENGAKAAGTYSATFNGVNLTSGIYFYRLATENGVITKKFTLVK
jgi:hypothetical protein